MKSQYDILSPDGFSINFSEEHFITIAEAEQCFIEWAKRYEKQGYYSANNKRIPLSELRKHCTLINL